MWNRTYSYTFERGESTLFHVADYVVFGLTLLVSATIGLFYAIKDRNSNNEKEFLLAGRNLSVFPVTLSLLSSFISAITLLGTPAEVYKYNTMYWLISIGFVMAATASAHIFIPVFYNLGVTTVIGKRFGDAGLGDLLLESGVIGSGSLTGVFEGKHYNRALRLLKIVFEAFERLRWEAFGSWLNSNDENEFLDPNFQHLFCQS
ncbi:Hypothetical predicted protein [Mytilus galloprovincialis]|uniref:Sodium-dependent multivitamin transporter n=1 Tax=Mytilus galloprovincialis TaxID=29158 RepID=A0A8B6E420_MYTGA|nr:Hypothetical predicted protein [Mytilus galloprovincialis]